MNRIRSSSRYAIPFATLVLTLMLAACSDGGSTDQTATSSPTVSPTATATSEPTTSPTATSSPDASTSASATSTPRATASPAATATADPDAVVLRWSREGGIAGFCDGLELTAGHLVMLGTCEDPGGAGDAAISSDALILEFAGWREEFASFEVEWADGPQIADGMTVRLTFVGRGERVADEETQRAIAEFAGRLFAEVSAARPQV